MKPILGIDFGGVISGGHTTDELMPGVVENVRLLSDAIFHNRIWIVSRVDDDASKQRVLNYMDDRDLWNRMGIPRSNIRFCLLRSEKAPIVTELRITHFVDDHTEVLSYMKDLGYKYALCTKEEELKRFPAYVGGIELCKSWDEIAFKIRNIHDICPERFLAVIEAIAEYASCDECSENKFNGPGSQIYTFAHIARNPSCLYVHYNWLQDFLKVEQELIKNRSIPNIMAGETE